MSTTTKPAQGVVVKNVAIPWLLASLLLILAILCSSFEFIGAQTLEDTEKELENNSKAARILTGAAINKRTQTVEVTTTLGVAEGTIDASESHSQDPIESGRPFYSFRGIPYAKPPIGQLRWTDPIDITEPWKSGRLDATRFQSICPQYNRDKKVVVGNEDCLYLNIFTPFLPDSSTNDGLPVLVFIHGGAYIRGGASTHGPEKLMRENIIVVTINHRLGVLGFLSTGDSSLAGNYGVLDQVSALRWVRRHIREFGGNPNAVTLGGFSAGASFVHLHLLSPLSKGLFHRAIMMSGAGNCLWSVHEDPWEVAEELASDLDCSTSSSESLKECLLLKDAETLIKAQTDRQRFIYWPFLYRPVVDGHTREEPFLPDPVWELEGQPLPSPVPVLIGATPEEGILFALRILLVTGEKSDPSKVYDDSAKYIFESLWPNKTTAEYISSALAAFYFSPNARKDMRTFIAEMTEATGDLLFMSCIWKAAENLLNKGSTVYTYLMAHHDPGSPSFSTPMYKHFSQAGVDSPLFSHGVSHGDDVVLLFSFPYTLGQMSTRDHIMSQMLTRFWANFVRTGSPQSEHLMSQGAPSWEPLERGKPLFYYRLSLSPSVIDRPYKYKEHNFWTKTLPLVEEIAAEASLSYAWQVATWLLLALVVLLVLLIASVAYLIRQKQKKKEYSGEVPTLSSQIPRLSSVRGS